jgi:hypothetical protein
MDGTSWRDFTGQTRVTAGGIESWLTLAHVRGTGAGDVWADGVVAATNNLGPAAPALTTLAHLQVGTCGDGTFNSCEACDPPSRPASGLQCGCDCQLLRCGNGKLEPGEDCDPPKTQDGHTVCDSTCHFPICGNKKLDPGEECDPPNANDGGWFGSGGNTCDWQCKSIPIVCGNGMVQPGEMCDFPDGNYCQNCQFSACADWIANKGGLTPDDDKVCNALTGTEKTNCFAVFNCMATGFGCANRSKYGCYCSASDPNCSAGASGECADQIHAFLNTASVTEVLRQLDDPTTAIARLIAEGSTGWSSGIPWFRYCPPRGLKISEIDYDQPGPDSKEFIEFHNDGGRTEMLYSSSTLQLIDYAGQTVYRTLPLGSHRVPPGGYLVIGAPAVQVPAGVEKIDLPAETDIIHNGPGGVCGAIYWGLPAGSIWDPASANPPVSCGFVKGAEPATLVDSDTTPGSLCAMPQLGCPSVVPGSDCGPTFDVWGVCATPTPGARNVR